MFLVLSRLSALLLLVVLEIYAALGLGFRSSKDLLGEVVWNWMDGRSSLHHPTDLPSVRWCPLIACRTLVDGQW